MMMKKDLKELLIHQKFKTKLVIVKRRLLKLEHEKLNFFFFVLIKMEDIQITTLETDSRHVLFFYHIYSCL
jgi:hypothetical protein